MTEPTKATISERSANMYRQGDVLILPASVPVNTTPVPRDKGRVILAYGEVTGHAHAIVSEDAILTEADGRRFLRIVGSGVDLGHEEHATITIEPGEYQVVIHREWTDDLGAQRVLD